ncbi:MAG: DUF167 domain-containing protein [bacterium]|nr:DUF167 domain-containing protein [bacterium]
MTRVVPLKIGKDGSGRALVPLHVQPRARRAGPAGLHDGALKLRLKSPPAEGRANAEAAGLLADLLGIPRNRVELVRGFRSRDKLAAVTGLSAEEVERLLTARLEEE